MFPVCLHEESSHKPPAVSQAGFTSRRGVCVCWGVRLRGSNSHETDDWKSDDCDCVNFHREVFLSAGLQAAKRRRGSLCFHHGVKLICAGEALQEAGGIFIIPASKTWLEPSVLDFQGSAEFKIEVLLPESKYLCFEFVWEHVETNYSYKFMTSFLLCFFSFLCFEKVDVKVV